MWGNMETGRNKNAIMQGLARSTCAGSGPFPALATGRICTGAEDKHWYQIYCNKSTILDI